VVVRLLAFLVAVLMMTAAATPGSASFDPTTAVTAIDDAPDAVDLGPAILPVPVVVPGPSRRAPVRVEAPRSLPRGRMHAVLVFRPPRLVAVG
jgi:hypothetical protein